MRIAVATTTIHVPEVLREYRRLGPEVPFVIAGDLQAPHDDIIRLAGEIGECFYLTPEIQEEIYPDLSEAIGWNNIQRRNIAILEAAKLEPDVIVSIDDDNIPTGDYFKEVEEVFSKPVHGMRAKGEWFNLGGLAEQQFTYRGYPHRFVEPYTALERNGKSHEVGILNGLIFGDPDVNAYERIADDPKVSAYSTPAQAGVHLDPKQTWTPINAQNTAYRADLAPLMLQLPRVGRYDDIWGSYIAQRVIMGMGLDVRFGRPFVRQERNEHNLEKDLADEEFGSTWTMEFTKYLNSLRVPKGTVLERLSFVLDQLAYAGMDLPTDFFDEWVKAWDYARVA